MARDAGLLFMPLEYKNMDAESRRRLAEEKKRAAIAARDARVTPAQRQKALEAARGILSEEDGEIFERVMWNGRRV
jgi:hypothetical protein